MGRYEYIEHTADKGVEVWAETLTGLFEESARALIAFMVPLETYKPIETREIQLSSFDLQALFVNWLSELLFIFDTESFLPVDFLINELDDTSLKAIVVGTFIDRTDVAQSGSQVKAITYHRLVIEELLEGWHARYFVDV